MLIFGSQERTLVLSRLFEGLLLLLPGTPDGPYCFLDDPYYEKDSVWQEGEEVIHGVRSEIIG